LSHRRRAETKLTDKKDVRTENPLRERVFSISEGKLSDFAASAVFEGFSHSDKG
jgi:hypothetical protein